MLPRLNWQQHSASGPAGLGLWVRNSAIIIMKALLPTLLFAIISATVIFAKSGPPINDVCPVDGKDVRIIYRIFTDKGNIAFCCVECMETYQRSPGRYPVKPKTEK